MCFFFTGAIDDISSTYKIPTENIPTNPHLSLNANSRDRIWRTGRARMATSVTMLIREYENQKASLWKQRLPWIPLSQKAAIGLHCQMVTKTKAIPAAVQNAMVK